MKIQLLNGQYAAQEREVSEIANEVYNETFGLLDQIIGLGGNEAGRIAAMTQKLVERELEKHKEIAV